MQPGLGAGAAAGAVAKPGRSAAARAQLFEAQVAQMQHEQMTGLYGDRWFPMLMQEHSRHRWEEMRTAFCPGR